MIDPNKTQLGGPSPDPNRTVMGAPIYEATVTIKPVQCPVCKAFNPPGLMFCNECGLIFDKALDGDAFGAPAVQVPTLQDSDGREYKLNAGSTTIGRQGDILVEDTRVSRTHARIDWEAESISITDMGSTNGTHVNGERIELNVKTPIQNGDRVSLGGFELTLGLPGAANKTVVGMGGRTQAMTAAPSAGGAIATVVYQDQRSPLTLGSHTFGRKPDNDIQIADPYVSGQHGVFDVNEQGVSITDNGSTNGTFVNEAKLAPDHKTLIHPGDKVRLGQCEITLEFKS